MEKTIELKRSNLIENCKTMLYAGRDIRLDAMLLSELWPDGRGGFDCKNVNEMLGEAGMHMDSITRKVDWLG